MNRSIALACGLAALLLSACASQPQSTITTTTPDAAPQAAAAQPATPQTTTAQADAPKDAPKKVCRREESVGSRFARTVCHDANEQNDASAAARGMQQSHGAAPGYMGN